MFYFYTRAAPQRTTRQPFVGAHRHGVVQLARDKECEPDSSGMNGDDNASCHGPLPREVVWPDAQEVTRGVPLPRQ